MKANVLLITCLLTLLISCQERKEQETIPIQSLKHELLMGDEYFIKRIADMTLMKIPSLSSETVSRKSYSKYWTLPEKLSSSLEISDKAQTISCYLLPYLRKKKTPFLSMTWTNEDIPPFIWTMKTTLSRWNIISNRIHSFIYRCYPSPTTDTSLRVCTPTIGSPYWMKTESSWKDSLEFLFVMKKNGKWTRCCAPKHTKGI